MKKSIVLAMAMVTALGVSSVCSAWGMPSVPGVKKETSNVAAANIDFTDLTNRQGEVLNALQEGLRWELAAYGLLDRSVGVDDKEIVAAITNLQSNKDTGKTPKMLTKQNESLKKGFAAVVNGTDQGKKDALRDAIAQAGALKHMAYISFGKALLDAPKLVSDVTSLTKGVKDFNVLNKAKGIISTGQQASKIIPAAKNAFDALNQSIGDAKVAVGDKQLEYDKAGCEEVVNAYLGK